MHAHTIFGREATFQSAKIDAPVGEGENDKISAGQRLAAVGHRAQGDVRAGRSDNATSNLLNSAQPLLVDIHQTQLAAPQRRQARHANQNRLGKEHAASADDDDFGFAHSSPPS